VRTSRECANKQRLPCAQLATCVRGYDSSPASAATIGYNNLRFRFRRSRDNFGSISVQVSTGPASAATVIRLHKSGLGGYDYSVRYDKSSLGGYEFSKSSLDGYDFGFTNRGSTGSTSSTSSTNSTSSTSSTSSTTRVRLQKFGGVVAIVLEKHGKAR